MRKKYLFFIFLAAVLILNPVYFVFAQADQQEDYQLSAVETVAQQSVVFKAKVIKVVDEKEIVREDGSKATQQNLLVAGLEGEWKSKEILIYGISGIDVVSAGNYQVGDKVLVQKSTDFDGNELYNIQDFDREGPLLWLALIFCLIILIIGRKKGFRSLLALAVTFLILIEIILPKILSGGNPFWWGLIGSFIILLIIIYLTEGWTKKSHLAILSVFFSLVVILFLSLIFTEITKLTGMVDEESMFLIGITQNALDFKGLLLASILIGAVGVLDDVIVGQIEAVMQIKEANPSLPNAQVYKLAYKVGNTHLGAIVNTLFLTYAGASLPLLLLFSVHQEPFLSFSQVINNEAIATEIVRTLVGSIGIALSMPIATFLGTYFGRVKK